MEVGHHVLPNVGQNSAIRLAEESGELDVRDHQSLVVVDEEDPPAGLNNLITASLCDLGCAERNALVAG